MRNVIMIMYNHCRLRNHMVKKQNKPYRIKKTILLGF